MFWLFIVKNRKNIENIIVIFEGKESPERTCNLAHELAQEEGNGWEEVFGHKF